jgi:hypothetical protein
MTQTQKAVETAHVLRRLLPLIPPVKVINSDAGGGLLISEKVRTVCQEHGMEVKVQLPNHPESHALIENANGLLRKLLLINMKYAYSKQWTTQFYTSVQQSNAMTRKYQVRVNGEIKTISSSPYAIAYGYDPNFDLAIVLGLGSLDVQARNRKVKDIHSAIAFFNATETERRMQLDTHFEKNTQIVPDAFVLMKRQPYDKNQSIYINNIFKVIERRGRQVLISSVFGNRSVFPIYIGFLKPFVNAELLKYLPPELRLALSGPIDITHEKLRPHPDMDMEPGPKVPFELKSTLTVPFPTRLTRLQRARGEGSMLARVKRSLMGTISSSFSNTIDVHEHTALEAQRPSFIRFNEEILNLPAALQHHAQQLPVDADTQSNGNKAQSIVVRGLPIRPPQPRAVVIGAPAPARPVRMANPAIIPDAPLVRRLESSPVVPGRATRGAEKFKQARRMAAFATKGPDQLLSPVRNERAERAVIVPSAAAEAPLARPGVLKRVSNALARVVAPMRTRAQQLRAAAMSSPKDAYGPMRTRQATRASKRQAN